MSGSARYAAVLVSFVLAAALAVPAQDCGTLPPWTPPPGAPQFTAQQKQWLFQFEIAQSMGDLATLDNTRLTAELDGVLRRLLTHLPNPLPTPQVHLLAQDLTDAATLPAGNIYISPAMIRNLRNEDELAAILAHELGHYYAGQPAIVYASSLVKLLNGEPPAATRDAFWAQLNRWQTYKEAHPGGSRFQGMDERQQQADVAAMEILRRAGYDSHAMATAFDRIAGTRGETGNWFTSLLGLDSPDVKRLRNIEQADALLPACPRQPPLLAPAAFLTWAASLGNFTPAALPARVPGLIRRLSLSPLRGHFQSLAFSTNGSYLLARDADGAWVLSVQPMALLFHIPAPGISDAHFNPANDAVVLSTTDGRVERWDIATRTRVYARQPAVPAPGCVYTEPDMEGRQLICVRATPLIQVLDADTGAVKFESKPPRAEPFWRDRISPDGRYYEASGGDGGWVLDLSTDQLLHLSGDVKAMLNETFAFTDGRHAVGSGDGNRLQWKRIEFPSGKVDATWKLGEGPFAPETNGPFFISRPLKGHAAGIFDPVTRKILAVTAAPDLDGYGDLIAGENARGVVVLIRLDAAHPGVETPVAHVELPRPNLNSLREGEASSDLRYLAVSEAHRGALWDLSQPMSPPRILESFDAAWFGGGKLWLHDLPSSGQDLTGLAARFSLLLSPRSETAWDLATGKPHSEKSGFGSQDIPMGSQRLLLDGKTITFNDLVSGKKLWSRKLDGSFEHDFDVRLLNGGRHTLLAFWLGQNAWKGEPLPAAARDVVEHASDKRSSIWFELLNPLTGAFEHGLVVSPFPTPNLARSFVLGGELYVTTAFGNRLLSYRLADGHLQHIWPGEALDASEHAGIFALLVTRHQLQLYLAGAAQPYLEYHFPQPVALAQFSADGRQLLVLTRDQTAYLLAVPPAPSPAAPNPL